jgi:hypothetical protein
MAEQMNELQIMMQERMNTGTAWTRNEKFDKEWISGSQRSLGS